MMRDEIEDRGLVPRLGWEMGKRWFEATTIGLSKDTIWGKAETRTSHTRVRRMWDVSSLVGYRLYVDAQCRQRLEQ